MKNLKYSITLAKITDTIIFDENNKKITATFKKLITKELDDYESIEFIDKIDYREKIHAIDDEKRILASALLFSKLEIYRTHWAIKKANLFSIAKEISILQNFLEFQDSFPPKPQKLIPEGNIQTNFGFSSISQISYQHKEIIFVKNVSQYIKEVLSITNVKYKKDINEFFFRGHSKDTYKLKPSLFRPYGNNGKVYESSEHLLYRELITAEPNFFNQEPSAIDTLARMQHYSMPTRLLDISSNPLTALYFACKDPDHHFTFVDYDPAQKISSDDEIIIKDNKYQKKIFSNGEVILFFIKKDSISFYDSDKVTCIANLVKLNDNQKNHISRLITKNTPSFHFIKKHLLFISNHVNKKININYRLPCGDVICSQYLHFIRSEKPYFEPNILVQDLKKIICIKAKKLDKRIQAQSGSFLLFGYADELPPTGNENIEIIRFKIKHEDKETILRELDLLGINEATIYPDIENSAKYIKEKLKRES